MASTETRSSFRLPWSSAAVDEDASSDTSAETGGSGDATEAVNADGTSEAVAMTDSEETHGPDMTETVEPVAASAPELTPTVPARRPTKFMTELSHAMQAAAEHARGETMARFDAEAKAVVEEIRAGATTEIADLRRAADDDVAAIREWSKAEIARIREETESRVAARKTGLESELAAHASTVEARAERVTAVVAAFEAEMGAFFERLNAEEDPTRIATMAETMPEPPSLEDVAASIVAQATAPTPPLPPTTFDETAATPVADDASDPETLTQPEAAAQPEEPGAGADAAPEPPTLATADIDFAAAEAEALSFDGDLSALDDDTADSERTEGSGVAAGRILELDDALATPDAPATSRVVVAGLVSVASIANFKRSLARLDGVWSIGVSSGPDGEFVFTVSHRAGLALASAITTLANFENQITSESGDEILVTARDRDAGD